MPRKNHFILLIICLLQTHAIFSQKNTFFSDSIHASEIHRTAIALGRQGLTVQALDTFLFGLEFRKELYGEKIIELAPVYLGIGVSFRQLGQYDLALDNFKLAEKCYLSSELATPKDKSRLYTNIGNVFRSKLDYNQALQYFYQALDLQQNDPEVSAKDISNINYKIAELYYLTNDYEKAIEIVNSNINNAADDDRILYYELLAFINQLISNKIEAKKNYISAISLSVKLYSEYPVFIANEYLNYSSFLIAIGDFSEANINLEKAFKILQEYQPKIGNELSIYCDIKGYYYTQLPIETGLISSFTEQKKENYLKAIEWFKKGLSALNFPEDHTLETVYDSRNWLSFMHVLTLLKNIGDTYKDIADLESEDNSSFEAFSIALEYYQIAGLLIQKARKEISSDESKIQLTELEHSTFIKLIETAFDAHSITKDQNFINLAFENAERTKSSSVFDKLANESALANSLIPDSLLQLEKRLNSTISIYSQKKFEESSYSDADSVLLSEYNTKIFEANRQREELNQHLEREYDDYYQLKYSQTLLSITDIQDKLDGDEVVLEYILNETDSISELYTIVISKKSVKLRKEKHNKEFINSIEDFHHFLSNPNYMLTTNADSKRFCHSSNHLYKALIAPHLDDIEDKRLIIIPDGKISYVSFDALLQELPDTSEQIYFNRLEYLIKDYVISYSNSANLLFKNSSTIKKHKNSVIAFAPEYKDTTIRIANQDYRLFPLPGVLEEVKQISETINNTAVFIKKDATEYNFRKHMQEYDILHLAMHAFINDSLPSFSRLAFQEEQLDTLIADGWLNTIDIYNLEMNAKLTVLSACNTGKGQLKKGEGLLSLARGFFYAGCPSVIMSLWEIEDQSATHIMSSFYKYLKKGKTKDQALRLAKLDYLENSNSRRAHPHYWLAYISLGDNSALYKSYDVYFFILLVILLLGISVDQFFRIKKARKKRAF